MTQYMLAVHHRVGEPPMPEGTDLEAVYAAVDRFNDRLQAEGAWVFGGGLHEPSTATVVHNRSGDVVTTDGPFIEAKEYLGGFWVITADDLDAALAWAKDASIACAAPVEVRPFQDEE